MSLKTLLLLLIIPFVGCGTPSSDPNSLVILLEKSPQNLDPRKGTDAFSGRLHQLLFNGLVKKNEQSELVPDLAESWSREDDTTFVFHLRRGVTFHDGREMTAHDVRFTYESMLDESFLSAKAGPYREFLDGIETPDPYTIRFRLKSPYASLLINLTLGIVPADEHYDLGQRPIGTGPYQFEEYIPDEQVILRQYPAYFEGPTKIEELVFRVIPDATTRVLELQHGTADVAINNIPPDALPSLEKMDHLKVIAAPGTTYTYLCFNLRDPILRDLRVRQAIAHAIDRPSLIDHLLGGHARSATGLLPPEHWAYEEDVPHYPYDQERAKASLDSAGYRANENGLRFPLLYKTGNDREAVERALVLQQALREIGIDVTVRQYEFGTFYDDIRKGNFQIFAQRWVGISDPDIFRYIFHSKSVPPDGANRGFFLNPTIDRLIDQAQSDYDPEHRIQLYSEVQLILARELPYVSLWYRNNIAVLRRDIRNFTLYPAADFTAFALASLESKN